MQSLRKSKTGKALFQYAEAVFAKRSGEQEIQADLTEMKNALTEVQELDSFMDESVKVFIAARTFEILSSLWNESCRYCCSCLDLSVSTRNRAKLLQGKKQKMTRSHSDELTHMCLYLSPRTCDVLCRVVSLQLFISYFWS